MSKHDHALVQARVYATGSSPCNGYYTDLIPVPGERRDPRLISCRLLNVVLAKGVYEVEFRRVGDDE